MGLCPFGGRLSEVVRPAQLLVQQPWRMRVRLEGDSFWQSCAVESIRKNESTVLDDFSICIH